jgi:hypothetical protein
MKKVDTRLARMFRREQRIQRDRLNKAAPALLDAAKHAALTFGNIIGASQEGGPGGIDHPFYAVWHHLKSAIAKAEGTK